MQGTLVETIEYDNFCVTELLQLVDQLSSQNIDQPSLDFLTDPDTVLVEHSQLFKVQSQQNNQASNKIIMSAQTCQLSQMFLVGALKQQNVLIFPTYHQTVSDNKKQFTISEKVTPNQLKYLRVCPNGHIHPSNIKVCNVETQECAACLWPLVDQWSLNAIDSTDQPGKKLKLKFTREEIKVQNQKRVELAKKYQKKPYTCILPKKVSNKLEWDSIADDPFFILSQNDIDDLNELERLVSDAV